MHRMLEEIREIPSLLSRYTPVPAEIRALAARLRRFPPAVVYLAGRGSSYHAALVGKYWIEAGWGRPVCILAPSVFSRYGGTLPFRKSVVIAISQSGALPELATLLSEARRGGGVTVALTNRERSALARAASMVLPLRAGPERAVPATKSYASSLLSLLLLVDQIAGAFRADPARLAAAVEDLLAKEARVRGLARELEGAAGAFVIGRGVNFPSALEVALKFQECAGILAAGVGAVDFFHGPIGALREGMPVLVIPPTRNDPAVSRLAPQVRERGGTLLTVPKAAGDEILSPIVYGVTGQLLAYHVAVRKGRDPDAPEGLSKVTRVAGSAWRGGGG